MHDSMSRNELVFCSGIFCWISLVWVTERHDSAPLLVCWLFQATKLNEHLLVFLADPLIIFWCQHCVSWHLRMLMLLLVDWAWASVCTCLCHVHTVLFAARVSAISDIHISGQLSPKLVGILWTIPGQVVGTVTMPTLYWLPISIHQPPWQLCPCNFACVWVEWLLLCPWHLYRCSFETWCNSGLLHGSLVTNQLEMFLEHSKWVGLVSVDQPASLATCYDFHLQLAWNMDPLLVFQPDWTQRRSAPASIFAWYCCMSLVDLSLASHLLVSELWFSWECQSPRTLAWCPVRALCWQTWARTQNLLVTSGTISRSMWLFLPLQSHTPAGRHPRRCPTSGQCWGHCCTLTSTTPMVSPSTVAVMLRTSLGAHSSIPLALALCASHMKATVSMQRVFALWKPMDQWLFSIKPWKLCCILQCKSVCLISWHVGNLMIVSWDLMACTYVWCTWVIFVSLDLWFQVHLSFLWLKFRMYLNSMHWVYW